MRVIKKITVFLLVVNVFLLPVTGYFIYENFKILNYQNEYELKRVAINEFIDLSSSARGLKQTSFRVTYNFIENGKNIEGKIDVDDADKEFEHFMNAGGKDEIFGGNSAAKVNDSIWVWHNPKAENFYAFGENDTFKTNKFWVRIIVLSLLCFIAFFSIKYQVSYQKKKNTLGNNA